MLVEYYSPEIEKKMESLYKSFSEKDRRRYAAIEAMKLGHGGIAYIAILFTCTEKTISKGIKELGNEESMAQETIRRGGGGRTAAMEKYADIDALFLEVLRTHTAGDPMDEKVKWTNLTRSEIGNYLRKKGIKVSVNIIRKLLKKHGYVKRKALKKNPQDNTKTGISSLNR